ncbi:hypothetical protein GGI26_003220 [Coemansia sp. RSA 1358]|nr:hypothetical protein GGI26_003220 [Coemansia sp. RSA 1358]
MVYPEEKELVLEPGRIRRILRKLLGKIGDLEEEVLLRPSIHKNSGTVETRELRRTNSDCPDSQYNHGIHGNSNRKSKKSEEKSGGGIGVPPAHPFEHLLLKKGARQPPKYTYKRSRRLSPSEGEDDSFSGCESTITGTTRMAVPKQLSRSSSLGSLSDSDMSHTGQDPALWLTTPRKRQRRRLSESSNFAEMDKTRSKVQQQSFGSRLEKMITYSGSASSNTYKARSLHSHLVNLGEMLWLGCPSTGERSTVRMLPLKILAAFRLGEAIALSDDCGDLDYLDEVYLALPPFLVRFTLWQHTVTLCYMRIPAYADTLSEAMWDVGAFVQQEWLINARMYDLELVGALLKPMCVVPLHMRAVDIGIECRFITNILGYLGTKQESKETTSDNRSHIKNRLWLEFVPPGALSGAANSDDEYDSANTYRSTRSGVNNAAVPSRYSKWVARISDPVQSVRLLTAALEQALRFIISLQASSSNSNTGLQPATCISLSSTDSDTGVSCAMAVDAIKAICSIIFTKLGSLKTAVQDPQRLASSSLRRCLLLMGLVTDIDGANPSKCSPDVIDVCRLYHTGLALLTLRHLDCHRQTNNGSKSSHTYYSHAADLALCLHEEDQVWLQTTKVVKMLLQHAWNASKPLLANEMDKDTAHSTRRSILVAQFDSILGEANNSAKQKFGLERENRMLQIVVLPLAVSGASPMLFYDIARLVGYDLGKLKAAKAIAGLVLLRFKAIWNHHCECRAWQQNWTMLQTTGEVASSAHSTKANASGWQSSGIAVESELLDEELEEIMIRQRLEELVRDLEQGIAHKAESSRQSGGRVQKQTKTTSSVSVPATRVRRVLASGRQAAEDELGLLLSVGRSQTRRKVTMLDSSPKPDAGSIDNQNTPQQYTREECNSGDSVNAPVIFSDDEYFDCKSNISSTKPSLECTASTAANVKRSSGDTPPGISVSNSDTIEADSSEPKSSPPAETSRAQRYRSLTNSQVIHSNSGTVSSRDPAYIPTALVLSSPTIAPRPSNLRRAATTRADSLAKLNRDSNANSLVEERARRAVKAMAEACTTGISIREADEKRSRAFSRILVEHRLSSGDSRDSRKSSRSIDQYTDLSNHSSNPPSENMHTRPRIVQNALHPVSSYNSIADRTRSEAASDAGSDRAIADSGDGTASVSSTPEPDSRALSMSSDRKALRIARSASLEARVGQHTRNSLSRWIMCFGSVYFDADQGPTLSLLYPYVPFSDSERAAICFSSMPDSTIHELYDSVYTFHFRVDPVRLGLSKDNIFLYGHVFFRQKRDPLMRRGGFQRSIVIISHLPYHGLFSRMSYMLGPMYFDLGSAILEAAAHNVSTWPMPVPGTTYELPFLGTALSVELPAIDASQVLETSKFPLERFDPGEHILASVTYDGLFRSFRDTLEDLWACWELMILGESLVVLADTPSRCSEAIVSLVDIIFPIKYCGDYRPYFTIQDPDFRAIVSKTHVPPNTVVGVSNPFFSEALSHWPHKLFLGSSGRMSQMHGASARKARAFGDVNSGSGGNSNGLQSKSSSGLRGDDTSSSAAKGKSGSKSSDKLNTNGAGSAGGSGGVLPNASGRGIKQGLQSKHKCAVNKDRPFAEYLLNAIKTGRETPWMVNNMLRRYFIDLTVQFLAPLDRYFSTLIPKVQSAMAIPQKQMSPRAAPWNRQRGHQQTEFAAGGSSGKGGGTIGYSPSSFSWFSRPGALRPWRTDDFMASMASFGISPQLSSRHSATTAADVLASVFSGNSSSAYSGSSNGSASGNSSGMSGKRANGSAYNADSTSASNQYQGFAGRPAMVASSNGSKAQFNEQQQSSLSFSLWKSKGSKKVSDEWLQLYTQFLKCGNFATWLAHRTSEAQRTLVMRFRQEVCQGDIHAWCRGYDYSLELEEEQLAAEIEMLELATMDLGQSEGRVQPHVRHVFYHGEAEDERQRAERHRQRILREQQERLAGNGRPVYGSDGSLVGFAQPPGQSSSSPLHKRSQPAAKQKQQSKAESGRTEADSKQLGQRITHAKRAQPIIFQAACLTVQLLGKWAVDRAPSCVLQNQAGAAGEGPSALVGVATSECPPTEAESRRLLGQLSILMEYMPAEAGCLFLPLVGEDYAAALGHVED